MHYVGAAGSVEEELARDAGLLFHSIPVGKLRRSLEPHNIAKNIRDQFAFLAGIAAARRVLARVGPRLVFSKGGFVGLPVVMAARSLGIPSIVHESDISPGLANRLCFPFATRVCVSFPETLGRVPPSKGVLTGAPVRPEVLKGDAERGRGLLGAGGLPGGVKPLLLIMGGSSGSRVLNEAVRGALPRLLDAYDVAHIVGKGNVSHIKDTEGTYVQFEYLKGELPHVLAAVDLVVSRAGANAIAELVALGKPMLLVPLERASRGDQLQNAASLTGRGLAVTLREADLSPRTLVESIQGLQGKRAEIMGRMSAADAGQMRGTDEILRVIGEILERKST